MADPDASPELLRKRGYSAATAEAARRFFNGDLRPDEVRPIVMKFLRAYFYRLIDLPHAMISGFRMKMRPEASRLRLRHHYSRGGT